MRAVICCCLLSYGLFYSVEQSKAVIEMNRVAAEAERLAPLGGCVTISPSLE
jgi:hypothetical protein